MRAVRGLLLAALLAAAPASAQPAAPVTISGIVSRDTAHVIVRFGREAEDVTISVRGEDGLKILSGGEPVKGGPASRGQRMSFDVSFERGPDRSGFTVEVTAKFAGESKTAAQAFRVGTPNDEQRKRDRERMTAPIRR